ncbi:MAG: DUF1292 domain-containing protein [Lachnospiraceae bacterium]|nr:DUF1292 domain-containing protein [Lachnospiraceae bacterium]
MEDAKNNAFYTEDDFDDIMTMAFDDGEEVECGILAIYPVGDREYIALYPLVQEAGDEYYIYRYLGEDGDDIEIEEIPEDDEMDAAEAGFNEYMDNLDIDDLLDEE